MNLRVETHIFIHLLSACERVCVWNMNRQHVVQIMLFLLAWLLALLFYLLVGIRGYPDRFLLVSAAITNSLCWPAFQDLLRKEQQPWQWTKCASLASTLCYLLSATHVFCAGFLIQNGEFRTERGRFATMWLWYHEVLVCMDFLLALRWFLMMRAPRQDELQLFVQLATDLQLYDTITQTSDSPTLAPSASTLGRSSHRDGSPPCSASALEPAASSVSSIACPSAAGLETERNEMDRVERAAHLQPESSNRLTTTGWQSSELPPSIVVATTDCCFD